MPGDMTYRAAQPADFGVIAQVWHESALSAEGAMSTLPRIEELRNRLDREIAAGWAVTVALDGRDIVGFLALKPAIASLDQIFILPAHQRRGIGRALLDLAKSAMPGGFTLRTASANLKARRFYCRAGLSLREEGFHPSAGYPVCYYGWSGER
jgi:ribosomal protein S18 acetylase RimI-like enzyme